MSGTDVVLKDTEWDPDDQSRHVPDEYEGTIESNYYCRAWNPRREKYCKARAGTGTEHLGIGRCKKHDPHANRRENIMNSKYKDFMDHKKMSPVERYRQLPQRLQDIYDEQSSDSDSLGVEADIHLARSILIDYIQRYDETRKKLDEWYDWYQEQIGQPPKVKLLPVEHVVTFLKKVTDIAHKEKKLRNQNAISLKEFYRIMGKMGKAVERWVMEPGLSDEEKLKKIKDSWMELDI